MILAMFLTAIFSQDVHADSIPFELVDNRMLINVKLNGKGPYKMVFDFGAGLVVAPDVASELTLPLKRPKAVTGAAGIVEAQEAVIDDVEFGVVHLRKQPVHIVSFSAIKASIGFRQLDGLVGWRPTLA